MSPLPEHQPAAIQEGAGVSVMSMLFLLTSQLLNSQHKRTRRDVSEEEGRQDSSQLLQVRLQAHWTDTKFNLYPYFRE